MQLFGLRPIWAALALAVAGCATPGPMVTEDVGAIRTGIAAVRQQSQASFTAANSLVRQQAVDRKVHSPELILRQSDFPTPVTAAAAQQWSSAFDLLDAYAAALQSLVDPQRAQGAGEAIGQLGDSLNGPTIRAGIPPSISGAFQAFGSALVQAKAEASATAVMRKTDPAFADLIGRMATAVGRGTHEPGSLYDTVESAWNDSLLPGLENGYRHLSPTDESGRRQAIQAYLDAMAARDAQLTQLGQLSQSLLALGEAHAAAARGRPGDALFWIKRIDAQLDAIRSRAASTGKTGGSQ
ncbi:MAG: hypothetical protein QOH81_1690 [Sphingomonadales bacterium]|jgi:hypothetical protein|nr:hypothetical protein [Sphingomonadales bacterium]